MFSMALLVAEALFAHTMSSTHITLTVSLLKLCCVECNSALLLFWVDIESVAAAVTLRVLTKQQDGHTVRLTAQEAAPQVFHAMFSQVHTACSVYVSLHVFYSLYAIAVHVMLTCMYCAPQNAG